MTNLVRSIFQAHHFQYAKLIFNIAFRLIFMLALVPVISWIANTYNIDYMSVTYIYICAILITLFLILLYIDIFIFKNIKQKNYYYKKIRTVPPHLVKHVNLDGTKYLKIKDSGRLYKLKYKQK